MNTFSSETEWPACIDRQLVVGDLYKVWIIPFPKSFNDFYIIRKEEQQSYTRVEELIGRTESFGLCTYILAAEDSPLCLVRHPLDKLWSRGIILKINSDENEAVVRFLDKGGSFTVKIADLRTMPKYLRNILPLAFNCSLPVKAPSEFKLDNSPVQAMAGLNKSHALEGNLRVQVIKQLTENRNRAEVDIFMIVDKSPISFTQMVVSSSYADYQNVEEFNKFLRSFQFNYAHHA